MSIRAYRDIHRRKSRQIMVGKVPVGGDAPITVQTMTNTITGDARATIDQIRGIEEAGADIVRVSCPGRGRHQGDEGHHQGLRHSGRGRHPFPLQARHRGGGERRGLPAHQSRQYRQRPRACAKWCRRPRIMAAPCASASMPARWNRTCWKNMASPVPKRWWKARSTTPRFSMTWISANTRFR